LEQYNYHGHFQSFIMILNPKINKPTPINTRIPSF
jgi:hypothetical protein